MDILAGDGLRKFIMGIVADLFERCLLCIVSGFKKKEDRRFRRIKEVFGENGE